MRTLKATFAMLFLLAAFAPSEGRAQQPSSKVYWMASTEVSLGQLPAYHAFAEKELNPLMEKHGYRIVVVWQTIVGDIEEVVMVAEFESMAAYHNARMSLLASEEWKAVGPKMDSFSKGIRSRFLSAAPYSKMK